MSQFEGATKKLALIEPEVFGNYVTQQQNATNRFLSSGILQTDPIIQQRLLQGGTSITIPNLKPLDADVQDWNDGKDIDVNGTSSYTAVAPQIYQAQSFGYTDFSTLTTGAPVAEQIASQFAQYWNVKDNQLLIKVLENTFKDAELQAAKGYGIGNAQALSAGDFLAALSRMGDVANPQLSKIVVNSATVLAMRAQNLIETVQPSDGGAPINYYNGLELVTDDAIPLNEDGSTTAYIISNGAVAYGLATPANGFEVTRDALGNGGQTAVINRRTLAMQLKGTSFTGDIAGFGINALNNANASLFKVVDDPRNIGVVKYDFKVDTKFVAGGINTPKKKTAAKATSAK